MMKNVTNSLPIVLTPMDVAEVLGISRNTAYQVVHSRGFPSFKVGKQYRVSRDKFLSWLDSESIKVSQYEKIV